MERVVEHLTFLWEKYELDMLTSSKQNIFMHAEEIYKKNLIYKILLEQEYSDTEADILCAKESIIDEVYKKIQEERSGSTMENRIILYAHNLLMF